MSDADVSGPALDALWDSLLHQGTVGSVAPLAVPFLLRVATDPTAHHRASTMRLANAVARQQHWGYGTRDTYLRVATPGWSWDCSGYAMNWSIEASRAAITADVDLLLPHLDDHDPEIRASASYALATASGEGSRITAALRARLATEQDRSVRAGLVLAGNVRPRSCSWKIGLLRLGLPHSLHTVDRERSARQLRLIGEMVEIAKALGVEVWLRGGWAMDFFIGEPTRDHEDIDWFAWANDASALADGLLRSGYEPLPGPPAAQQLDFCKQGVECSFALLDKDRFGRVVVAGGPWTGELWPEGMLDESVGRIGPLRCQIISPRTQIEIKQMMPVWVPGRPRRKKDAEDITRLEAALRAERGGRHTRTPTGRRGPQAGNL